MKPVHIYVPKHPACALCVYFTLTFIALVPASLFLVVLSDNCIICFLVIQQNVNNSPRLSFDGEELYDYC